MSSERTLHRCSICGDWFCITPEVMLEHYAAHDMLVRKFIAISELTVKKACFAMLFRMLPWPYNMQYYVMLAATDAQIEQIKGAGQ